MLRSPVTPGQCPVVVWAWAGAGLGKLRSRAENCGLVADCHFHPETETETGCQRKTQSVTALCSAPGHWPEIILKQSLSHVTLWHVTTASPGLAPLALCFPGLWASEEGQWPGPGTPRGQLHFTLVNHGIPEELNFLMRPYENNKNTKLKVHIIQWLSCLISL